MIVPIATAPLQSRGGDRAKAEGDIPELLQMGLYFRHFAERGDLGKKGGRGGIEEERLRLGPVMELHWSIREPSMQVGLGLVTELCLRAYGPRVRRLAWAL